ncbi:MAG TPA: response regulator [Sphingomonadales bacterium]|nr:response regulator [Sphingomonadales bacterium]
MEVRVLIVDDDPSTRNAVVSLLKTEGWVLETVGNAHAAMEKLREGPWHLVIASLEVTKFDTPLFESLQALDEAEAPLRVLFLVSAFAPPGVEKHLEQLGLPHTVKPLRVDDFLEAASDLLVRAHTISQPLRRVKELATAPRPLDHRMTEAKRGGMFAERKGYDDFTEEELKEFEDEEEKKRKAKEGEKPPD